MLIYFLLPPRTKGIIKIRYSVSIPPHAYADHVMPWEIMRSVTRHVSAGMSAMSPIR